MFVISLKSLLWPWCSSRNVYLSQSHDPEEEENEISSSAMIACAVSWQFKVLFLIVGVSLHVATGIFSWSCIFPYKCVLEPLDFKVLLQLICSISLLQHTTVKVCLVIFLVLYHFYGVIWKFKFCEVRVSIYTFQIIAIVCHLWHSSNLGLNTRIDCACHDEMSCI